MNMMTIMRTVDIMLQIYDDGTCMRYVDNIIIMSPCNLSYLSSQI